jgi:hypothetical protein
MVDWTNRYFRLTENKQRPYFYPMHPDQKGKWEERGRRVEGVLHLADVITVSCSGSAWGIDCSRQGPCLLLGFGCVLRNENVWSWVVESYHSVPSLFSIRSRPCSLLSRRIFGSCLTKMSDSTISFFSEETCGSSPCTDMLNSVHSSYLPWLLNWHADEAY